MIPEAKELCRKCRGENNHRAAVCAHCGAWFPTSLILGIFTIVLLIVIFATILFA